MKNFVFFMFIFLLVPSVALAQEDHDGQVYRFCFQAEPVDCSDGTVCPKDEDTQRDNVDCDIVALERDVKSTNRKVRGLDSKIASIFETIEELRGSNLDTRSKVQTLEELFAELPEGLMSRSEIESLVITMITEDNEKWDEYVKSLVKILVNRMDRLEVQIKQLEDRQPSLGVGGSVQVGMEGVVGGAGATLYLPLGSGPWTFSAGGYFGGSNLYGQKAVGYGAHASATYGWQEDEWTADLGPSVLVGIGDLSTNVGVGAATFGGGVEFRSSFADIVVISITPFVGVGGVQAHIAEDGTTRGGELTFTGGALFGVEVTPF